MTIARISAEDISFSFYTREIELDLFLSIASEMIDNQCMFIFEDGSVVYDVRLSKIVEVLFTSRQIRHAILMRERKGT